MEGPRPSDWLEYVNEPGTAAELEALRRSVVRGAPYGDEAWQRRTAKRLGLEATLRPRGRPAKKKGCNRLSAARAGGLVKLG